LGNPQDSANEGLIVASLSSDRGNRRLASKNSASIPKILQYKFVASKNGAAKVKVDVKRVAGSAPGFFVNL